jgi:hypothetical protein
MHDIELVAPMIIVTLPLLNGKQGYTTLGHNSQVHLCDMPFDGAGKEGSCLVITTGGEPPLKRQYCGLSETAGRAPIPSQSRLSFSFASVVCNKNNCDLSSGNHGDERRCQAAEADEVSTRV